MSKEKTIKRVQKLLAMAADGSSPHEAAIAAKRARKLMDEYQLTVSDLAHSDDSEFGTAQTGSKRRFTAKWEQSLAVRVAEYNDCVVAFVLVDGTKQLVDFEFRGMTADADMARVMFRYLVENGKRLCSHYIKSCGFKRYNARLGTEYKDAYSNEIRRRLQDLIDERSKVQMSDGKSLMIVKQDLVEQKFGKPKYGTYRKRSHSDREAIEARIHGTQAGRTAQIHLGVGDAK